MSQLADSSPASKDSNSSPSSQRTQTINVGRWSEAEDTRLREAVHKHGNRWVAVAPEVGTRNSEQCAKRWNDNLNPNLDHSFWSVEEDKLLLHLVASYGHNWKLMKETSFQARSPLALKNRYCLLQRRQNRQNKRQQRTAARLSDRDVSTITPPSDTDSPPDPEHDPECLSSSTYHVPGPLNDSTSLADSFNQPSISTNVLMPSDGMYSSHGFDPIQVGFGADQYRTSLATVSNIEQESIFNREYTAPRTGWNKSDTYSNVDLDRLFSGADMSFDFANAPDDTLNTRRPPDAIKPKE